MKERRVRFTATAGHHVEHQRAWWLANRHHHELFATELEHAEKILAILPGIGTPYVPWVGLRYRHMHPPLLGWF